MTDRKDKDVAQSIKDKLLAMSEMVDNLEKKVTKGGRDNNKKSSSEPRGFSDSGPDRLKAQDLMDLELGNMRRKPRQLLGDLNNGPMMGGGPMMRGGLMDGPMMRGGPMDGPMMRGGSMDRPMMGPGRNMGMMDPLMMGMAMMAANSGPAHQEMQSTNHPPIRVLGELLHEEDVVEEFDDALGNGERRIVDFIDSEAPCLRTFYVGNVPASVSEAHVREYFETFGVLETIDMTSKKRLEKSFFRIVAQEASTVDRIQRERPHTVQGKEVTTKRALLQKDKKVGYMNTNSVYIGHPFSFSFKTGSGGLTNAITEDQIKDCFSWYGRVNDVSRDEQNFGGAYVNFQDKDAADKVALLRGFIIGDRAVEVEKVFNEDDIDEENCPDLNLTGDPEHKILRKIVAFNLPSGTKPADLKEHFGEYGDIEECFVPQSKSTGKLFAVIIFAKSDSVDLCLENRPHRLYVGKESREIIVKRPQPRGEDRDLANADRIKFWAREPWDDNTENLTDKIKEYFQTFGTVETIRMLEKPRKRMGFVIFNDEDVAQKVSMLYLHKILDREVECQRALDSRTYREKKQQEMMHTMRIEQEMACKQMMMENMEMMRRQAQFHMTGEMSGLTGIGGDGGMGKNLPQRRLKGFDSFQSPMCIIIEDVPEVLTKQDMCSYFSKFGAVVSYSFDYETKKGYIRFREEYMTDYCARKTTQTIGEHTLKISKGPIPDLDAPKPNEDDRQKEMNMSDEEENDGDGRMRANKRRADNPLMEDDDD